MQNRETGVQGAPLMFMAVHAHPDDEVFSTGGSFAQAADRGIRTVLVCATNGEEGEIHDPDLDAAEARHRLGDIRREELRRAADVLAITQIYYLDYRDSGMAGTEANADPRNFHNADPEEATGRLVRIIRRERPDVVVTYDERGGYGHPDHIAAHRRTVEAVDAAGDPARFGGAGETWSIPKLYFALNSRSRWSWVRNALLERGLPMPWEDASEEDLADYTAPDDLITTSVDVSPYLGRKHAALRLHRTQMGDEPFFRTIPQDISDELLRFEYFQRARSSVSAPLPETDLFAGLI